MSKWTFGWVLILFIDAIFALRGIAEKNPRTIRGVTIYKSMVAARGGDADAMKRIGDYHIKWNKSTESYKQALDWYLRAAQKGQPQAMSEIGRIYMNNLAGELNYEKSRYWLEKAIATDPENVEIMWIRLLLFRRENDKKGFISLSRRIEEIKPGYIRYRINQLSRD